MAVGDPGLDGEDVHPPQGITKPGCVGSPVGVKPTTDARSEAVVHQMIANPPTKGDAADITELGGRLR